MTRGTGCARVVRLVATDATRHRDDGGGLRHRCHLRHVAVAHRTLHSRLKVLAVRPGDAWSDLVNADPGNRLRCLRKFSEFLNCRTILRHVGMAHHAGRARGKRHHRAGIRIGVALLAAQSTREVCLMTIRNWLLRRGRSGNVSRNLRDCPKSCERQTQYQTTDLPHDLLPTASMLVPQSFRIAAAALRPGNPVIDPPGGVQAPV